MLNVTRLGKGTTFSRAAKRIQSFRGFSRGSARLEFPAVLFSPAFDDNFLVGVELNRVAPLSVQIAEETVLPSAEREVSHGRGDPNIDANVSRRRFVAEAARGGSAGSNTRGLVSISAAFEESQRFVHAVGVHKAEHGAEDFRICQIAGCRNVIENSRLHEVAGFGFADLRVA